MAYTLRNKIRVAFPEGKYKIYAQNGDVVYAGNATKLPNSTSSEVVIDVAPIFRQLVTPFPYENFMNSYSNIWWNEKNGTDVDLLQKFTIETSTGNTMYFNFYWDYKYEYDYEDGDYWMVTSYGIQDYIYSYQFLPFCVRQDMTYIESLTLENDRDEVVSGYAPNTWGDVFANVRIDNNRIGQLVKYLVNNENVTPEYRVVERPKNAVTLYYINLNGGLSFVQCDCKNVVENNISRTQITHNVDIEDNFKFGLDNYHISNYKTYKLNTNWLNDDQSKKLQELFMSPRVWIHDYNENENGDYGVIKSVVITDTKSTVKNKINDKMFNYTITCKDSKTENIFC